MAFAVLLAACGDSNSPAEEVDCPDPQVLEESAVEADGVVENLYEPMQCVDYLVPENVEADGTLRIEPGVVMAFDGGRLNVPTEAELEAVGSSELPIVLTGSETAAGSWGGIVMLGAATLEHVTVEKAGSKDFTNSNYDAPANITLRGAATLQMRYSIVRDGAGFGIFSQAGTSLPDFEDNAVSGNALGAVRTDLVAAHYYGASSSYAGNQIDGLFVNPRYSDIEGDVVWERLDVPYVITKQGGGRSMNIPQGNSLQLQAGAVVEIEADVPLVVRGRLQAAGAQGSPVRLTSRDPANGRWAGLVIRDNATATLDYVEVSHAGASDQTSSNYEAPANIVVRDAGTLQMRNSVVRDSAGFGLFADHKSAVPGFEGNKVTANALGAVRTDAPTAQYFGAGNDYLGNGEEGIFVNPRYGSIDQGMSWTAIDVPYVVTKQGGGRSLKIEEGGSLTLSPGVSVQVGENVPIVVAGSLSSEGTEQQRIEITNVPQEPNFGGILVKDGTATFAYTTITKGGGVELGFDDIHANVVISSFTAGDDAIGQGTFGPGTQQSGAEYGLGFDNWGGSEGTTKAGSCVGMAPIYWPEPDDKAGQC